MKKFLLFIFLCTALWGEISISVGQTSGRYLQNLTDDGFHQRQSVLAGRPALFFELDSLDHPLFLANDFIVYGIGAFAETRYRDYLTGYNNTTFIPLYANYYLKLNEQWMIGAGINFNIMQLRYKTTTTTLSQQLGKNILLRYKPGDYFMEGGLMQTCSIGRFDDVDSFFDATNYVFKFGYYLERNKF